MKRLLIAICIGILLTVLFFATAAFMGGACHCVTPTTILFPYAATILNSTGWESVGLLLLALQFPLYTIIGAHVREPRRRILVLLVILGLHALAVLVGLRLSER